jgi:hypothetical protein
MVRDVRNPKTAIILIQNIYIIRFLTSRQLYSGDDVLSLRAIRRRTEDNKLVLVARESRSYCADAFIGRA